MVRFSLIAVALAAAASSAFADDVLQVTPNGDIRSSDSQDLGLSPAQLRCSSYTDGTGEAVSCPSTAAIGNLLVGLANTLPGGINSLSQNLMQVLGGSENPLGAVLGSLTETLLPNVGANVGGLLGALSGQVQNSNPACKCDISTCAEQLYAAAGLSQADIGTGQNACEQAAALCGRYMTNDAIIGLNPLCRPYLPSEGLSGDGLDVYDGHIPDDYTGGLGEYNSTPDTTQQQEEAGSQEKRKMARRTRRSERALRFARE
ncbi:hypothetical protein JCM8097_001841 [Rhodosporidiobolus ruineniae]